MTSSELKAAARNALKDNFFQKLLLLIVPLVLSVVNNRITNSYSNDISSTFKDTTDKIASNPDAAASIDFGPLLAIIIPIFLIILLIGLIMGIILTVFQTAALFNYMEIFRGEKEEINLSTDIFRAFKDGYFWKIFSLTFVISVIMFILMFIPIIGWGLMIYLGLGWSQATYVLYDKLKHNEYQGVWDVLNTSKMIMTGYKFKYFVFNLTFIGWYILNAISFGWAQIWTMPYTTMSMVAFYEARIQDRL
ncbi:MAG: DUF975 family protein [Lactococcus sp.]|uniref:Putative integral membrane protein n=1 Tax=Pseudolactococcus piscium MKFS47 TaxID=297352 RepID=A0A0D6DZR5_9LACT|nr:MULTISPECIES: DUF975 family protein [Lactococcus]MDN5403960.1 DUF975 family protein [Lactococcus sp.]MDN5410540.1 DUF975 family protein [Lactococcus sp.]MDN5412319.1 DUF975 family protein [Lactococcus sp.]MDN5436956.1 DUF975 family protein [Lactococcus sp.]MDN5462254.1 DUF975 family protein [Lactococcus sp.]